MTTLLGLLLIFIGAFSSGSFAVPFGGIKGWKWENYWLSTGLFSFILIPLIVCLLLVNDFGKLLTVVPTTDLAAIFILGAVYGIGSLTFGLSMRYLGLSLGYALSLGLMAAIGTLVPPALDGRFGMLLDTFNGNSYFVGRNCRNCHCWLSKRPV
jgi:L-rhamnose-H+ transport protein